MKKSPEPRDLPPAEQPAKTDQWPIKVGNKVQMRVKTAAGHSELFECHYVGSDGDAFWCIPIGLMPLERSPSPGTPVVLIVRRGSVSLTAESVILTTRFTRRGLGLGLRPPDAWAQQANRSSQRVEVRIQADVLRKEDLSKGQARLIAATIQDISESGARIRSRLVLRQGEQILLAFSVGNPPVRCTATGLVMRAIHSRRGRREGEVQGPNYGYEVGITFQHMTEDTRSAIRELMATHADSFEEAAQELKVSEIRGTDIPRPRQAEGEEPLQIEGLEWVDKDLLQSFLKAS